MLRGSVGLVQLRLAHNSGVAFSIGATLPVGVRVALTAANDSPEAL